MKLSIETPEKVFFDGEAETVILPTPEGEMGVLDSHMLMVVALDTAEMRIKTAKDGWQSAAVSGGFAHIKGTEVVVLTDTAEWPWEIDANKAEEAKRRAEEAIRARQSEIEYLQATATLKKALVRLKMARGGMAQ